MKRFDLTDCEYFMKLSSSDVEELKEYLLTVPLKKCINFIDLLVDKHYQLSEISKENDFVQDFLVDMRFDPYRLIIMKNMDENENNGNELTDFEWREAERQIKKFQRAKKLAKIDGKKFDVVLDIFPEYNKKITKELEEKIEKEEAMAKAKQKKPVHKDMNWKYSCHNK